MADKEQVKTAVESLGSAFEEFKKTNDQRLAQIEKKGSADPVTEDKLKKIESEMDKIEELNQAVTKQNFAQKEQAEKTSRLEKVLSRPASSKDEQTKVDEQKKIFDNYLRKGKDNLDPDELKV